MEPQPQGHDPLIGQTIGNYRVTQKLGEGGMGSVYLAEHPHIGKKVALKVLHAEFASNQEVVARFFNEARAVNDIGHPNIVDIVDYGVLSGGPHRDQMVYFIMEYLGGRTLTQLIRQESPLPPERALTIALQVADALAASHRTGIIHRDLKPDNIMLLQRGREQDFVKLLDFGIAKLTTDQAGSRRTRTGIVMGTPAYMSPEQCEGRGEIDLRTDVYALGIVVYEMLTGRVPFVGEGYGEILVQHLTQPPAPPSTFRGLSPHVEAIVLKALEKRRDLRFPTMEEFMRAMADPVGYVEAMGGIAGFTQRPIRPSNAPLGPISRLTPSPLVHMTPAPGTLSPTSGIHQKPTTLSSASGQTSGGSARRVGVVLAVALLLVGASTGIYLATRDKSAATTTDDDDGSAGSNQVALGSNDVGSSELGSSTTTPDLGSGKSGSAQGAATGSGGSGSAAGSGTEHGSASEHGSGAQHGSGHGSGAQHGSGAGDGTGSATQTVPERKQITLKIVTSPPGAVVFLDNKRLGLSPGPFVVDRVEKKLGKLEIKLSGYRSVSEKIALDQGLERNFALKKKSGGGGDKGSGTGKGSNGEGGGGDNLLDPDDM
jgi:serine/threonine protein kinase